MIRGVGIDLVTVTRFNSWVGYTQDRLLKVFNSVELYDCQDSSGILVPEKLATRFAAKEAFYKAFSVTLVSLGLNKKTFSLRSILPHVFVTKGQWDIPEMSIEWLVISELSGAMLPKLHVNLSLSHEETMATAIIIIEDL